MIESLHSSFPPRSRFAGGRAAVPLLSMHRRVNVKKRQAQKQGREVNLAALPGLNYALLHA